MKLAALGFSGDILQYLTNYLSNRKQFTVVNGSLSSESNVNYGVPQGSLLGPVCFLGCVNDLPEEAQNENGETNLFADDSTTFEIGNTVDDAINKIKKTAKHIESYSNNNSLTIHPDKCELLIISKSKFIGPMQNLNKGRPVNIVESSKSLGITIDNKFVLEPTN